MQSYKYDTAPSKGKERAINTGPFSTQPLSTHRKNTMIRPRVGNSTFVCPGEALPASQAAENVGDAHPYRQGLYRRSNTWLSSNADVTRLTKEEEIDTSNWFVAEYNRLAKKHGVRFIVSGGFPTIATTQSLPSRKDSWISKMFRHGSNRSRSSRVDKTDQSLRYRRSISNIALQFVHNQREGLKNEDVRSLIRLCGKSMFYLPAEYATSSLVLPTCLRATAQYLVQHANTSGIFRISGSVRTVNALYDYYCADTKGEEIATTTRCPNLPLHVNCGVHDVASTFKRLLAGLPGGILGSLSLFDALVAIHSQLHGYAENNRTKESKLRARLIALTISTVRSHYQRDLICSVFGLLCLVGRGAETAPREDRSGRPLPITDLMGYHALSIVFGPLLVGDLLKTYSMKLADPAMGLVILPVTPYKPGKYRRVERARQQKLVPLTVDKVYVANEITEMILIHWRDVVRHLKDLNTIREQKRSDSVPRVQSQFTDKRVNRELRKSISEPISLKRPPCWEEKGRSFQSLNMFNSSHLATLTPTSKTSGTQRSSTDTKNLSAVKNRLSQPTTSASLHRITRGHSVGTLSPTVEEIQVARNDQECRKTSNERSAPHSQEHNMGDYTRIGSSTAASCLSTTQCHHEHQDLRKAVLKSDGMISDTQSVTDLTTSYIRSVQQQTEHISPYANRRQKSSSSQGTTRRHSLSPYDSDTNQIGEHRKRFPDSLDIAHALLRHDMKSWPQCPVKVHHLPYNENDAETSSLMSSIEASTHSGHRRMPCCLCMNENTILPIDTAPVRPILAKGSISPFFNGEESHSYHPSVMDPLRNSPEYVAEHLPMHWMPDTSQKTSIVDQQHHTEASSVRSLGNGALSKSPHSLLQEKNSHIADIEKYPDEGPRIPSTAIRLKELVKYGPMSSSKEIKGTWMARHSLDGLTPRTNGSPSRPSAEPPTPGRKRQLLNKKSDDGRQPAASLSRSNILAEELPRNTVERGSSSMFKGKRLFALELPPATQTGSFSPRSISKPVSGTVRSLAARFDGVSQGHAPANFIVQEQCLLRPQASGRHPPREARLERPESLEPSAISISAAKAVEPNIHAKKMKSPRQTAVLPPAALPLAATTTPNGKAVVASRAPEKNISHPEWFQAKLRRIGNSSRSQPKPSIGNYLVEQPTVLTHPGFVAARNIPPTTPIKMPRQISRFPSSPGTMTAAQDHPQVTRWFEPAPRLTPGSGRSYNTPRENDDALGHRPRLASSGSNTIHRRCHTAKHQLDHRNPEAVMLHRQVSPLYSSDVGTLNEQLRQAKHDRDIWKERAEAAEKRVIVLEKFAATLRSLKEGIGNVSSMDRWDADSNTSYSTKGQSAVCEDSSGRSNHTEGRDMFGDRMRSFLKKGAKKNW